MIKSFLAILMITFHLSAGPLVFESEQISACKNRDPTLLYIRYIEYYCSENSVEDCRGMVSRASNTFADIQVFDLTDPNVIRAYIHMPQGGVFEAGDGTGDLVIITGSSTLKVDFDKTECTVVSAYWDR